MAKKESVAGLSKDFFKSKKVQWAITIILFLAILVSSIDLRLSNLPILKDSTSGEYISNDLDSLYFYRIAETKMANNGTLPAVDILRSPGYNVTWLKEILPDVMIGLYKIEKIFSPSMTFDYSAAISGPIIYGFLLIAFFILTLLLTRSKTASVVSSALLAFAPAFLFRSTAGFYDHDHLGVLAVILLLIIFTLALKRFEKSWKETAIWGILLGLFTALVLASWGGAMTFVLVALPLAFFFYYLLTCKKPEKFLVLYALWIVSSVIFPKLMLAKGFVPITMVDRFFDSQGIAALFVFGFALIDFLFIKFKKNLKFVKEQYEKAYSFGLTIILGLIGLILIGKSPLNMAKSAWSSLIYPFGTGRLGTTVAENAQPYLKELIAQNGQVVFWLFLFGMIVLAIEFSKNLKFLKERIFMSASVLFIFLAILYSRYSSSSLLNGENFFSQALYLLGALTFLGYFVYVFSRERFKIDIETIILFAITLTVVINARAAVRSFFLITPFICLLGGYFILGILRRYKEAKKDKRLIWMIFSALSILLTVISLFVNFSPIQKDSAGNYAITKNPGSYQITSYQAKNVGPSANSQWQEAMAWARNETAKDAIFVHWWDYGYFTQTLGERPAVTDGGHSAEFGGDVNIGRYLLTTPNPETAYSFMKSWNVSYLLIDPTELGKYGAFSKIGSNDSWDRVSTGVSSGESDSKNNKETASGTTRIYNINSCVDEDLNYGNVFLPGINVNARSVMECKSYLAGVIIEMQITNQSVTFKQPMGAFFYNNKRYDIPIKNLYAGGKMVSFSEGIDSVAYVIPKVLQSSDGRYGVDSTGAIMYLSPRVKDSLVGRLYVLDDYYKEYSGLKVAYAAEDPAVAYFNQLFGVNLGEFVYFQGLRAPLKIWSVDYPAGTETHEEFLDRYAFSYGGLDYLFE